MSINHRAIFLFYWLAFFTNALAGCQTGSKWIGSWSSPPSSAFSTVPDEFDYAPLEFLTDQFIKLITNATLLDESLSGMRFHIILKPTISGEKLRLRFSNDSGLHPLVIGNVSVSPSQGKPNLSKTNPSSKSADALFGGNTTVTIAPGEEVLSDAVSFSTSAKVKLMVTFDVIEHEGPATRHSLAWETSYISYPTAKDNNGSTSLTQTMSTYFLTGLEVEAPADGGTIVILGDSISEGAYHLPNTNHTWPNLLAQRLENKNIPYGVSNQSIWANRLIDDSNGGISALNRLERDVFNQPNVESLIVFLGTNDLADDYSADAVFEGLLSIADQARKRGICVAICTVPPREDLLLFWNGNREIQRRQLNQKILADNGRFNLVIDINKLLSDPNDPHKPYIPYYAPDLMHTMPSGLRAIANVIPIDSILPPPYGDCEG